MPSLLIVTMAGSDRVKLTFVFIIGSDGEDSVLDVFIFIDLSLVKILVEIWRVVVFVRNTDANIFRHRIRLSTGIGSS